jgi:FkbM family methyltransferase
MQPDALGVLASRYRALPHFRGKGRVALALHSALRKFGLHGGETLVTMRDGRRLNLDPRSRTELLAYWTGVYDDHVIAELIRVITPGSTVLDIGANIGWYTIAFARAAQRNCKVVAFEPIPANVKRLQQNIAANSVHAQVEVVPVALSDTAGQRVAFSVETDGGSETGNAIMVGALDGGHTANAYATTATLDEYIERYPIDCCPIIKIDVEGAELLVLRGGEQFLRKYTPIVYAEFNRHWAAQFGYDMRDIEAFAGRLGYRVQQRGSGDLFNYVLSRSP